MLEDSGGLGDVHRLIGNLISGYLKVTPVWFILSGINMERVKNSCCYFHLTLTVLQVLVFSKPTWKLTWNLSLLK